MHPKLRTVKHFLCVEYSDVVAVREQEAQLRRKQELVLAKRLEEIQASYDKLLAAFTPIIELWNVLRCRVSCGVAEEVLAEHGRALAHAHTHVDTWTRCAHTHGGEVGVGVVGVGVEKKKKKSDDDDDDDDDDEEEEEEEEGDGDRDNDERDEEDNDDGSDRDEDDK